VADVQTFEMDAELAPVTLAQQWIKFFNRCWATQGSVVKQWISLLEAIVGQQGA
jgi:hypothetical protein